MRRLKMLAAISAWLLCGGLSLSAQARSAGCVANPADQAAVVNTLRTMYAAATADDMLRLHAVFAQGSYLFDGGTRFDSVDALMQVMRTYRAKGMKFAWNVTQPDVHVHCQQAWIAYVNLGSMTLPGASKATPTKWLESANLEKQHGVWKIVFFQSTIVPPPEPTK